MLDIVNLQKVTHSPASDPRLLLSKKEKKKKMMMMTIIMMMKQQSWFSLTCGRNLSQLMIWIALDLVSTKTLIFVLYSVSRRASIVSKCSSQWCFAALPAAASLSLKAFPPQVVFQGTFPNHVPRLYCAQTPSRAASRSDTDSSVQARIAPSFANQTSPKQAKRDAFGCLGPSWNPCAASFPNHLLPCIPNFAMKQQRYGSGF